MVGIGQVRGRQWDSRKCYNKSLELAKKRKELPQTMEVGKMSKGPMETNIDLRLQENESTGGLVEELVDVQMDPKEPSRIIKISKGLNMELAQQLTEFLRHNQDVFAWTHAYMKGIHPEIMCHLLNIDLQAKPVHPKQRELDVNHYKALQNEVDRLLKIGFIRESYYPN